MEKTVLRAAMALTWVSLSAACSGTTPPASSGPTREEFRAAMAPMMGNRELREDALVTDPETGAQGVSLDGAFSHVLIARIGRDGSVTQGCAEDLEAAEAMFFADGGDAPATQGGAR